MGKILSEFGNLLSTVGADLQVATLPTASADFLGKIVQYIGTTNATYTNGYFYKCVYDGSSYSWEQVKVQDDSEINENIEAIVNVYGSKNLNRYPYHHTTKTAYDVTWTDNGDGTISTSGTASENYVTFTVHDRYVNYIKLDNGTYILTGCPEGGGTGSYYMYIAYTVNGSEQLIGYDTGNGLKFTVNDNNGYINVGLTLVVRNGQNVTGKVFKPMIRDARISDSTYVPYAPTNRELMSYVANGKVGAKNLLPYPYYQTTKTVADITFTDIGDGTVTVSGLADGNAVLYLTNNYTGTPLPKGRYAMNGCPSGGSSSTYYLSLDVYNTSTGQTVAVYYDYGEGVSDIFVDNNQSVHLTIVAKNGTNLTTPITFKPMIRIAEDTDNTYAPYAMTNRELTEELERTYIGYVTPGISGSSFDEFVTNFATFIKTKVPVNGMFNIVIDWGGNLTFLINGIRILANGITFTCFSYAGNSYNYCIYTDGNTVYKSQI